MTALHTTAPSRIITPPLITTRPVQISAKYPECPVCHDCMRDCDCSCDAIEAAFAARESGL